MGRLWGGGGGVWRCGGRGRYLSPHCHHQNDSCNKMGSNESHFNVWVIVRNKVIRQCPQTTTFQEKGEPKQIRTEVSLLTNLMPLPLGQIGGEEGGGGGKLKACPIKIEILLEPVTAITCLQSKAARKLASKVPWECWAKGLKSWSPFRSVSSPLAPVGTAHTGPQGLWGSAQRVLLQRGISPSKFELCFTILHVTPPSLLASCFEYSRQNATRMLYRERNALNDLGSMPQECSATDKQIHCIRFGSRKHKNAFYRNNWKKYIEYWQWTTRMLYRKQTTLNYTALLAVVDHRNALLQKKKYIYCMLLGSRTQECPATNKQKSTLNTLESGLPECSATENKLHWIHSKVDHKNALLQKNK